MVIIYLLCNCHESYSISQPIDLEESEALWPGTPMTPGAALSTCMQHVPDSTGFRTFERDRRVSGSTRWSMLRRIYARELFLTLWFSDDETCLSFY